MKSAAAATDGYDEIALDATRVDAAMALVAAAGWNQTPADWALLIREGRALGLTRRDDHALVASATVAPLGARLSWIGMVLVRATDRRRGLATRLMNRCIDAIDSAGAIAGLDATPEGREVYRGLGFEAVASLARMGCPEAPGADGAGPDIRPAGASDLDDIAAFDRAVFGADRSAILGDIHRRLPGCAFLAEPGGRLAGYVLARPGRLATQIGPLVADDGETAERLVAAALGVVSGPVVVDAFRGSDRFVAFLRGLGFAEQRPFTRMLKGPTNPPHDPRRYLLAAGPELG